MSSDKRTSEQDKEVKELSEKMTSLELTEEQRKWIESMIEKDEEDESGERS